MTLCHWLVPSITSDYKVAQIIIGLSYLW